MARQMRLWVQFLVSVSRSVKSVSIAQSRWSRMPLLNVSSACPSRPLHLPSARSAHLLLTDPNMGASIMVPTHAKKPSKPCHLPCSHKEDFQLLMNQVFPEE